MLKRLRLLPSLRLAGNWSLLALRLFVGALHGPGKHSLDALRFTRDVP